MTEGMLARDALERKKAWVLRGGCSSHAVVVAGVPGACREVPTGARGLRLGDGSARHAFDGTLSLFGPLRQRRGYWTCGCSKGGRHVLNAGGAVGAGGAGVGRELREGGGAAGPAGRRRGDGEAAGGGRRRREVGLERRRGTVPERRLHPAPRLHVDRLTTTGGVPIVGKHKHPSSVSRPIRGTKRLIESTPGTLRRPRISAGASGASTFGRAPRPSTSVRRFLELPTLPQRPSGRDAKPTGKCSAASSQMPRWKWSMGGGVRRFSARGLRAGLGSHRDSQVS